MGVGERSEGGRGRADWARWLWICRHDRLRLDGRPRRSSQDSLDRRAQRGRDRARSGSRSHAKRGAGQGPSPRSVGRAPARFQVRQGRSGSGRSPVLARQGRSSAPPRAVGSKRGGCAFAWNGDHPLGASARLPLALWRSRRSRLRPMRPEGRERRLLRRACRDRIPPPPPGRRRSHGARGSGLRRHVSESPVRRHHGGLDLRPPLLVCVRRSHREAGRRVTSRGVRSVGGGRGRLPSNAWMAGERRRAVAGNMS